MTQPPRVSYTLLNTSQSAQPTFHHLFKMTGFDDDQVIKYLGKYELDTKLALLSQQVKTVKSFAWDGYFQSSSRLTPPRLRLQRE